MAENPVRDRNYSTCRPWPVLVDWQDIIFHFSLSYYMFFINSGNLHTCRFLTSHYLIMCHCWQVAYLPDGSLKQTNCYSISTLWEGHWRPLLPTLLFSIYIYSMSLWCWIEFRLIFVNFCSFDKIGFTKSQYFLGLHMIPMYFDA